MTGELSLQILGTFPALGRAGTSWGELGLDPKPWELLEPLLGLEVWDGHGALLGLGFVPVQGWGGTGLSVPSVPCLCPVSPVCAQCHLPCVHIPFSVPSITCPILSSTSPSPHPFPIPCPQLQFPVPSSLSLFCAPIPCPQLLVPTSFPCSQHPFPVPFPCPTSCLCP